MGLAFRGRNHCIHGQLWRDTNTVHVGSALDRVKVEICVGTAPGARVAIDGVDVKIEIPLDIILDARSTSD